MATVQSPLLLLLALLLVVRSASAGYDWSSPLYYPPPSGCDLTKTLNRRYMCDVVVATEYRQTPQQCAEHCKSKGSLYFSLEVYRNPPAGTCECLGLEGKECSMTGADEWYKSTKSRFYTGAVADCEAAVDGDPHFVGASGLHFDFNGELGRSFCLFTDKKLHINALFDGYVVPSNHKLRSWIKNLSLSWRDSAGDEHQVVLNARRGKESSRGTSGLMTNATADGVSLQVPTEVGKQVKAHGGFSLLLKDNTKKIKGGMDRDTFTVSIDGVVKVELSLNAEMQYLQTPEDAHVHFNIKIVSVQATSQVHGVLGQTFRRSHMKTANVLRMLAATTKGAVVADGKTAAAFLEGTTSDYKTSALANTDCKVASAWNEK